MPCPVYRPPLQMHSLAFLSWVHKGEDVGFSVSPRRQRWEGGYRLVIHCNKKVISFGLWRKTLFSGFLLLK